MPLFKKSKNDDAQRLAELELQQTTLSEIDVGISSDRYVGLGGGGGDNLGPWYTPTSISTGPQRSYTLRTGSSIGFSPASTLPSPGASVASSPFNSPPTSPPPVLGPRRRGPEQNRFNFTNGSRAGSTSTLSSAKTNLTYTKRTPSVTKKDEDNTSINTARSVKKETPKKQLSSILKRTFTKSPTLSKTPSVAGSSNEDKTPEKKSPRRTRGSSPSRTSTDGRSSSPPRTTWAPSGRAIPVVTVVTRNGEVSNNNSKTNKKSVQLPANELTPNMRPRPGNKPKISRKIQTEPVDKNFQLVTPHKYEEDEPEWLSTYTKHKKIIWVVFATIVFFFAVIIGLAASANESRDYDGAFIQFLGEKCSHFCRHRDRYPENPLIVIALDGFRYDYLEKHKNEIPNLRRLGQCGVTAKMTPSFPAETSPNLWTIVSGYFPQFHGIVSDWILDYKTGEQFNPRVEPKGPGTVDAGWFHDPALWEIARRQGKVTASHSWIGNNLKPVHDDDDDDDDHYHPEDDRRPTHYSRFDPSVNYMSRMETVLEWLNMPASRRPTYVTVYFEDPGSTARRYGTTSAEVISALTEIDQSIGFLLDNLMEQEVVDCFNFMVVSTSGMVDTNCDDVYYIDDDLPDLDNFTISPDYLGSLARITPKETAPDDMDTVEEVIDFLQCKINNGHPYLTDETPYRLHGAYGHHLEEAVIIMEDGWTFAKQQSGYSRSNCRGANNGYEIYSENMTGIFIGFGKDFKIGHSIQPFQNIELFNLMTDLINVKPLASAPPSDGSPGYLNNVLKRPGPDRPLRWGLLSPGNERCQYPETRREVDVGCTCSAEALSMYQETADINIEEKDGNLEFVEIGVSTERNAPFGIPGVKNGTNLYGDLFCILYQNNYITGYDHFLEIPTFVSFTIDDTTGRVPIVKNCSRYDQRLDPEKTPRCTDYYNLENMIVLQDVLPVTYTFLFQPSLSGSINAEFDALITSNIVPQYIRFAEAIWEPLADRIRQWADNVTSVNIVAGPAYDLNSDSHKDSYYDIAESYAWVGDTPVPTHYYVIATSCQMPDTMLKDCPYDDIATMAYIFPHTNNIPQCFNFDDYLARNRATVHDVETLTGLAFYPDWSMDTATRMELLRFKKQFKLDSSWVQF